MEDQQGGSNVLYFMKLRLPEHVHSLLESGNVTRAIEEIKSLLQEKRGEEQLRFLFELERIRRLAREYPYSVKEAFELASKELPSLSLEEFQSLIAKGCVDSLTLDGEVKVFRRFIPNMFWLCPELEGGRRRRVSELEEIARETLRRRAMRVSDAVAEGRAGHLLPLKYTVRFTLRVAPREPCSGKVRVWVPIPREEGINRGFRILQSHPEPKALAPPDHPQRTAYFELEGEGSVSLTYEYVSYGFAARLDPSEVWVDESSDVFKKYTAEKPPHIAFTDYLVRLTERVVGGEKNPLLRAKRIWEWITSNVRYTFAQDYALYDNISEYVARNLRGDCGMQALLFITMARIAGIPARWQSGWYMNPVRPGMHDWAQIFLEPYGWVYVDPSFGNKRRGEEWRTEFYFGSIEGFRLAANSDISTQFYPPKKHFRSDPVDNQQGEVECDDRNLYYDEWESRLEILEVERVEEGETTLSP
ncbi:transglutaminase-like domain-containing protein [Infirmifilum sp. SLHALR2]|nr:MAG: hypothetical protein B7L53_04505 [Thermofilum sp. NZ13]